MSLVVAYRETRFILTVDVQPSVLQKNPLTIVCPGADTVGPVAVERTAQQEHAVPKRYFHDEQV